MSDLENALLYSLTHEVGSRNTIVGPSLTALQEYLNVLVTHFPGRDETMDTLSKLRNWVVSHNDALRGEDLISEISDIRATTGSFTDTQMESGLAAKEANHFMGVTLAVYGRFGMCLLSIKSLKKTLRLVF